MVVTPRRVNNISSHPSRAHQLPEKGRAVFVKTATQKHKRSLQLFRLRMKPKCEKKSECRTQKSSEESSQSSTSSSNTETSTEWTGCAVPSTTRKSPCEIWAACFCEHECCSLGCSSSSSSDAFDEEFRLACENIIRMCRDKDQRVSQVQEQKAELEEEVQVLKDQVSILKAQLAQVKAAKSFEVDKLHKELAEKSRRIAKFCGSVQELKSTLIAWRDSCVDFEKTFEELELCMSVKTSRQN